LDKAVVLQKNEILCASGTLKPASESILSGKSAICKGPFFDIDTVCAPFPDRSWATLSGSVHALKSLCGKLPEGPGVLFIYAAAKGDIGPIEKGTDIPQALLDHQARKVAKLLGIRPSRIMVVSSACASGAIAVQTAKEVLEREMFENVVIFGYDVISRFVVSGFHSLNALSSKGAKPFDKSRDGLNLGDGAALSVLTYKTPSQGDIIVAGAGCSNDANHRTGPSRTGDGLLRAAQAALEDASAFKPITGAVKCHGTATVYNDAMEAKAITALFDRIPPIYSIKGAIGHTSGAGSLLEIMLAAEFLKKRKVPPTTGFEEPGVEEKIPVSSEIQEFCGNSVLCLSAGFGGLNAAVVLKEHGL
jgi:3-oxoacyl-[acyl-carrier-protein] synthase-1